MIMISVNTEVSIISLLSSEIMKFLKSSVNNNNSLFIYLRITDRYYFTIIYYIDILSVLKTF